MKKLFLQSGKLMIGEFPEEPTFMIDTKSRPGKVCAVWNGEIKAEYDLRSDDYAHAHADNYIERMRKKHRNEFEAAKASAVEVVNPEAILTWDDREVWFFEHRAMAEDKLYDIPSGWTVKEGIDFLPTGLETVDIDGVSRPAAYIERKIARLIPTAENAQGEIKYMHDRECRRQKDEGVLCQDHCYFKTSGLKECPVKSGIVATGIPEAGQRKYNSFKEMEEDCRVRGGDLLEESHAYCKQKIDELQAVPESGENAEHLPQWIIDYDAKNFSSSAGKAIRILMNKLKSVSPPSQADRDSQEELWKEAINLYSKRDHSADGRADMMKEFTITRKTKP